MKLNRKRGLIGKFTNTVGDLWDSGGIHILFAVALVTLGLVALIGFVMVFYGILLSVPAVLTMFAWNAAAPLFWASAPVLTFWHALACLYLILLIGHLLGGRLLSLKVDK